MTCVTFASYRNASSYPGHPAFVLLHIQIGVTQHQGPDDVIMATVSCQVKRCKTSAAAQSTVCRGLLVCCGESHGAAQDLEDSQRILFCLLLSAIKTGSLPIKTCYVPIKTCEIGPFSKLPRYTRLLQEDSCSFFRFLQPCQPCRASNLCYRILHHVHKILQESCKIPQNPAKIPRKPGNFPRKHGTFLIVGWTLGDT